MSHSEHSSNEKKPVAFTVPFILASVTVVVILMFLSLCDPKAHGHHECDGNCSKECTEKHHGDGHSMHGKQMGEGHDAVEACTDECKESCAKGDHSKHGKHEQHGAPAEAAAHASDSLAKPASEAAPAH